MSIITWLHISDIHFQPKKEWRDNEYRQDLLSYLSEIIKETPNLKPDLIFCTGDIAFGETSASPIKDQYERAKIFFDELLKACGSNAPLGKDRIFVVPGNHDIDRKQVNNDAQVVLQQFANNSETHAENINQRFSERTLEFRDAIKRLSAYGQFISEYLPHLADPEQRHCYTRQIKLDHTTISITGFNSSWSAAGDEDDRNIWLAASWQFNSAKQQNVGSDYRIGLIHHPVDWLNQTERNIATVRISTEFDFWLHGHTHNPWVTPTDTNITIGAGAVGAATTPEFGFNITKLDTETGDCEIHLHTRNANGAGWTIQPIAKKAPSGVWRCSRSNSTSSSIAFPPAGKRPTDLTLHVLEQQLNHSLQSYSSQPVIWIDPTISRFDETAKEVRETTKISELEVIDNGKNSIFIAPPQYGLTCFSKHLCVTAWKIRKKLWIYLNATLIRPNKASIVDAINRQLAELAARLENIHCVAIDCLGPENKDGIKFLKVVSELFPHVSIVCTYQRTGIADIDQSALNAVRPFEIYHLWSLPKSSIRSLVAEYNAEKYIGDEDAVTSRVVADLEALNLHRTALNCLTLLKASELDFDENPVNRSEIIKRILFLLFNVDQIPSYKSRPDLKDCEFVLGYYCQQLIQRGNYSFSRNDFITTIQSFCRQQLIELEIPIVFDILYSNNIIVQHGSFFGFRFSYWILYFSAHRMHHDAEFAEYIFSKRRYANYPEIIEFYTGIDRKREDALKRLLADVEESVNAVQELLGLPEDLNPYKLDVWKASPEAEARMQEEVAKGIQESNLPAAIKDHYADKSYDRRRPYNQDFANVLSEQRVAALFQIIRAASRALRNSDYVAPETKRALLKAILRAWDQVSKVILVIIPALSSAGHASYDGTNFILEGDFGENESQRALGILKELPGNVVTWFQEDIFSQKMSPLLAEQLTSGGDSEISRHELVILMLRKRPRDWEKLLSHYISSVKKDSFYLLNVYVALQGQYRYSFASNSTLKDIEHLIRMAATKHVTGDKSPGVKIIEKTKSKLIGEVVPERQVKLE